MSTVYRLTIITVALLSAITAALLWLFILPKIDHLNTQHDQFVEINQEITSMKKQIYHLQTAIKSHPEPKTDPAPTPHNELLALIHHSNCQLIQIQLLESKRWQILISGNYFELTRFIATLGLSLSPFVFKTIEFNLSTQNSALTMSAEIYLMEEPNE